MTNIESNALNHFLSEYSESLSYDEVMTSIECEHDSVVVWAPFENYDAGYVIEQIENLKITMTDLVKASIAEARVI